MSNSGKSLTNISFRSKILAVIDKLKNQDKTALVRHVDDFEALNKDTFEAGMNALVEAIPEGGGGGGGGGSNVYEVTLDVAVDMSTGNLILNCDKTISEIRTKTDKALVFNFNFEIPNYMAIKQKLTMIYTEELYEGGEFSLTFTADGKTLSSTSGQDLGYYKSVLIVSGSIINGTDSWELQIAEIESDDKNPGKDNDIFKYFNAIGDSDTPSPYLIQEYISGSFNNAVSNYFRTLEASFLSIGYTGPNAVVGYRERLDWDGNGYMYYNKAHCIWIDFQSVLRNISFTGFATLSSYYFGIDHQKYIEFYIDITEDIGTAPSIHRFIFRFLDDNNYNLIVKELVLNSTELVPNIS